MTENYLTNQRFTEFTLDPALVQGIEATGFEYCTPIQAETLPHLLGGRDVAGQAKTGTGKTAAYLVALFQHLLTHPPSEARTDTQPRAIVLAPTRELAIQIDKDARLIGQHLDLRLRLVYGGTGYEQQRRDLRMGVDVLVGTPGRIIDYLKQGIYTLDALQVVILDEADRMFDLGFIKDIRYLFRRMPAATERLNMLFSATLSLRVNELAYEHMNNPQMVKIESDKVTVDQVTQRVYFPANADKLPLLLGLLRDAGDSRTVVFLNTKHYSERVADTLQASGFKAGVLSGDVPQNKRERLLESFKSGEVNVLVATDVAARGLHIPDVSRVVNYDLPQDAEDYVHRIGRTARAGAAGDAISFACETYAFSLPDIETFIGHKIEPDSYGSEMLVQPSADAGRRGRGERKSAGRGERRPRGEKKAGAGGRSGKKSGRQPEPAEAPATEAPVEASHGQQADAAVEGRPESGARAATSQDGDKRGQARGRQEEPSRQSSPESSNDSPHKKSSKGPSKARPRAAPLRHLPRDAQPDSPQDKPGRKPQRRSYEIPAVG